MALAPYPKLKTALFPQYTAPSVLPPDITLYHLIQVQYLGAWYLGVSVFSQENRNHSGSFKWRTFSIGNYLHRVIAEWRNQICDGDTNPKLTKNKAINTSEAIRTVQESSVIRTQKLELFWGAKVTTRRLNRSWEHRWLA